LKRMLAVFSSEEGNLRDIISPYIVLTHIPHYHITLQYTALMAETMLDTVTAKVR
jgi:hypothetical protein